MSIFILLILGLIQGLCEFLPISSSGHLVLISTLFGVENSLFVSIVLHLATLLAVIIVMRKEIFYLIKHPLSNQAISVVIATIITCAMAIVLMPFITSSFEGKFLPIAFLLSAILLFLSSRLKEGENDINYKNAVWIGLAQGFAIFPGLSRSGTTISAGLFAKCKGEESAKFSFLISIPIILASLFFEVVEIICSEEIIQVNWAGLALAFVIAFAVGLLTIKFMLKLTKKGNFKYFAIYLVFLSILSALLMWKIF